MRREFTIEERIEIGKRTFDKLIETGYDLSVKEEMAKEYGVTLGTIHKYVKEYRERVVEPKPTYEELLLFKRLAKNATKSFEMAEKLLESSEEEMIELIKKYGKTLLIAKIDDYINSKPEEKENIEKLKYIKERLNILHEKILEQGQKDRSEKLEQWKQNRYTNLGMENIGKIDDVIRSVKEFIDSSDYYPNYIFSKNLKSTKKLKTYFDIMKQSPNVEIRQLVLTYYAELEKRENEFVKLVGEVYDYISQNNPNILSFYRMTHISINKFKTFLRVAVIHNKISGFVETELNNYFDKYIIGSYSLPNFDEALKINYEYNGQVLTPEDIKTICKELYEKNIPINKNSIIYTFEEKVSSKVNKR